MRIMNGLKAGLMQAGPISALLLIPAGLTPGGTWIWPKGLAFALVFSAITLTGSVALARFRPETSRLRQEGVVAARAKKQPLIDAVGSALLVAYLLAWVALIPVDVFRLHLLPAPAAAVSWAGGLCAAAGAVLTHLAVWQNEFAAPNVQDQSARGQRVIDSGVYGWVRHPIYAGNLMLFGGMALWLGSYAALIGVLVLLVGTVGRIAVEERHLRAHLPGYADYAHRVRGRLVPFVL
jgi:protein-S-isoprenylcysteine O-methyltransferase Ste14